jgi:hypothetical protein
MDRARAPRKTLELISKRGKPMEQTSTRWFSQAVEGIIRMEIFGGKAESKNCGKN